jgi:hypothetical protein
MAVAGGLDLGYVTKGYDKMLERSKDKGAVTDNLVTVALCWDLYSRGNDAFLW